VRKVVPKRVRREASVAREQILDAAERRLSSSGPAGLRLQEIAADVGVSHPTILHHFGSREGLVEAVVTRALEGLQRDILAALAREAFEPQDAAALLRTVMTTLGERGHARLLAWLALERGPEGDEARTLQVLGDALHARRVAETGRAFAREDTMFVMLLAALALVGEGILDRSAWHSAGLDRDAGAPQRFHSWLIDLLAVHLHEGPRAPPSQRAPRPRKKEPTR
jgi:AcrR family transcriptional regulator